MRRHQAPIVLSSIVAECCGHDESGLETMDEAARLRKPLDEGLNDIVKDAVLKFTEHKIDTDWDQVIRDFLGDKHCVEKDLTSSQSSWSDLIEEACATKDIENKSKTYASAFRHVVEMFPSRIFPHAQVSLFEECISNRRRWKMKACRSFFILNQYKQMLCYLLEQLHKANYTSPSKVPPLDGDVASVSSLALKPIWELVQSILEWVDQDFVANNESSSYKVNINDAQNHRNATMAQLLQCFMQCVKYQTLTTQNASTQDHSLLADDRRSKRSTLSKNLTAAGLILCYTFQHQGRRHSKTCTENGEEIIEKDGLLFPTKILPDLKERLSLRSVLDSTKTASLTEELPDVDRFNVIEALQSPVARFTSDHCISAPWTTNATVLRSVQALGQLLSHLSKISKSSSTPKTKKPIIIQEVSAQAGNTKKVTLASSLLCDESPNELLDGANSTKDLQQLVFQYSRALFFGRLATMFEREDHDPSTVASSSRSSTKQSLVRGMGRPSSDTRMSKQGLSELLIPVSSEKKADLLPKSSRKRFPSGIYEINEVGQDAKNKISTKTPSWHAHPSRVVAPLSILPDFDFGSLAENQKQTAVLLEECLPLIYSLLDDFKPKYQTLGGSLLVHLISTINPTYIQRHTPMIQQVLSMSIKTCRDSATLGVLSICQSTLILSMASIGEDISSHAVICSKISDVCQTLLHKAQTTYTGLEVMDNNGKGEKQQTTSYNEGRRVTPAIMVGGALPLLSELAERVAMEQSRETPSAAVIASGVKLARSGMALFLPILNDYTPRCLFGDKEGVEFVRVLSCLRGLELLLQCAASIMPRHGGKIMTAILTVVGRIVTSSNNDGDKSESPTSDRDPLDQMVLLYATSTATLALEVCQSRAEEVLSIAESECMSPLAQACRTIRHSR
jgi:hypothetical protein